MSHIAMLCTLAERQASRQHVCDLLRAHHLPLPDADSAHLRIDFGLFRLRWEMHTEFVTYTVIRPLSVELADALLLPQNRPALAIEVLPQDWLAALPGQALTCLHVWVLPRAPVPTAQTTFTNPAALPSLPGRHLLHEAMLVGAAVAEAQAEVYTDFAIHADGYSRMLLLLASPPLVVADVDSDSGLNPSSQSTQSHYVIFPRSLGRLVQQLIEIETYRMVALLGLAPARAAFGTLASTESELAGLAQAIRTTAPDAEAQLLDQLTALAGQIESLHAATHARFSASAAYFELVDKRIADIAETRLPGLQTIGEFIERRLSPARSTCAWAARRQDALSQRVSRMSNLLRTRVEIEQQQSSQALLQTMNLRQGLQLKLQTTVEGLSVAAITYYTVGLIAYLSKGAKELGWPLSADTTTALAIPLVVAVVWCFIRAQHLKIAREDNP